ncbi:hypothetical protein [Actinoplanes ianthinogenes]|uniref:SMODS-associated NUDIX domain-containing protein n=1 Tax=Actinoplanes ianthinogenes TaxID=122358 RepID=UPI00167185AD|nr:hypothetical protein [Actinoplanes ianthinogenes]
MISNIVAGLITAVLLGIAGLLWGNRKYLAVLPALSPGARRVRVSMAALLRVKDEDCYVLFSHPYRPGVYGPPGGVVKYAEGARRTLDSVGFVEQRSAARQAAMRHDLRGFLPLRSVISFLRWYASGRDRESAVDCVRRELREELAEVGHPELVPLAGALTLTLVRGVFERPPKYGRAERVVRRFDVYDVIPDDPDAVELVNRLVALGRDPAEQQVIAVSSADIELGRHGPFLVAPQSAFLLGTRRFNADLPPLR